MANKFRSRNTVRKRRFQSIGGGGGELGVAGTMGGVDALAQGIEATSALVASINDITNERRATGAVGSPSSPRRLCLGERIIAASLGVLDAGGESTAELAVTSISSSGASAAS
jgi:hypothetical protein